MQTSVVNQSTKPMIPGQWADLKDIDPDSGLAQGNLRFGAPVVKGDEDHQMRLPDAGDVLGLGATTSLANQFIGVVIFHGRTMVPGDAALEMPIGDNDAVYIKSGKGAAVATTGSVFVLLEAAVTKGQKAYFRETLTNPAADPQTEMLGGWRADDDGGNATGAGGSYFEKSGAAGDVVPLRIKLRPAS